MNFELIIYNIAQYAPGFLLALVCHEWAHGYVAKMFGDDTAERSGRLTFNPVSHIDPIGTVVFPLVLTLMSATPFGWAKPVPVNSRNFKNIKKGIFWVSFAGPLANLFLGILSAFVFAILVKHVVVFDGGKASGLAGQFSEMLKFSMLINFIFMGFNLIPLPPLDGSRMLSTYLKGETLRKYEDFARYTPMVFLGLIALSYTGLNIFGYILGPFVAFGYFVTNLFISIV